MDDLKKKILFQNRGIQIQTLWRLQKEVAKKQPTGYPIDASTPEIPELTFLLDCLSGADELVTELTSQVLLNLVEENKLDFTFALNTALNLVPSVKFMSGVAKTVYGLLTLQALAMDAKGIQYRCPYALRSPPHPLISVLTNRPDAWPFIIEGASDVLEHQDQRIRSLSVELLRPFVIFVLSEPQQSDHYAGARAELQRFLLSVCRYGNHLQAIEIIELLLQVLPKMQVEKKEHVTSVSQLIEDMALIVTNKSIFLKEMPGDLGKDNFDASVQEKLQPLTCRLLTFGLEILQRCINARVVFCKLITAMIKLSKLCSVVCSNSDLLLVSNLLTCWPAFVRHQLLALVQEVVSRVSTPHVLCLATLVKPLLQIIASPCPGAGKHQESVRHAAGQLLLDIEAKISSGEVQADVKVSPLPIRISPAGYMSSFISDLCSMLTCPFTELSASQAVGEPTDCCLKSWLENILVTLIKPEACTPELTNLICAILVASRSTPIVHASVKVIVKIAQVDQKQAPDFLPLILYTIGRTTSPESRLILLESVPQLATHKLCVPPILKTIQALGKSRDLKATSIHLMVLLWQQQDRCFSQLLQVVSEPNKSGHQPGCQEFIDDVLLAKAAAILEICKRKPEHHGSELLAPLSDILNVATSEEDTAASVLALEGLCLLCQAEVVDLHSPWSVLGEKLKRETRPLVITRVCQLLSLVPDLALESQAYEAFTEDAVFSLWLYSNSSSHMVCAAAFSALSKFNTEQFRVSYLPRKITEELYYQAEAAAQQQQTEAGGSVSIGVDQMFPQVPGYCYMLLLQQLTSSEQITGYQTFIHSMIAKEVSDLPRGIYYSSLRRQGIAANQGKALDSIPKFLSQQYDRCKQPGLLPGLAAGLLFCYDPPMEVGRDGRPRKHYVVRHGKTFLQTFTTLLNEVPVQPSEWHRTALMPQAWNSFMERLFLSQVESQKAELELQEKQGQASISEVEENKSLAWLVAREAILEAIKSASKHTPAAQANSVLALAGLALVIHKFTADLDPTVIEAADHSSKHMGHSHWLTVTCDTIFSLFDIEYKPKGGLHGLCQQNSTLERAPASTLCGAMARLAASQLVLIYTATDSERIVYLLAKFSAALPRGTDALESPVMAYCNGLALGMLLSRLFEERYAEMTGSKGMLAVWKSLRTLEEICLTSAAENRTGCVLGLGLALCGMCSDGKTESRVHVTTTMEKLQSLWMSTPVNDPVYEPLCVTVTSIAGSVYASNTSSEEAILPVVSKLKEVHAENPQISGVCLALGLLTFSMTKLGQRSVLQMRQELVTQWLQDVIKEDRVPMERVAKLTGLLSMIGSEQTLIPTQGSSMIPGSDVNVSEVIATVSRIVVGDTDLGLQWISAWMLGHLYLSACAVAENRSSVPSNYGYLPDSSILRAVVDFLLEAGRLGPESVSDSTVSAALESLNIKKGLPPINWAGVLSPFMRINFGQKVKILSFQTAVSQMVSSPSAAMFVSSWLTPPLFTSLQTEAQVALHLSMPEIIRTVSPSQLKMYFERSCLPAFTQGNAACSQLAILQGLHDALAIDDPPDAVTLLLHNITGQIYHALPSDFNIPVLQSMAKCFMQVPDDVMDSIIVADFSDSSTQIKGSFVRCYLVAKGKQPLALLNYMIDASFNTDYWNQRTGMLLLTSCLANFSKTKGQHSEPHIRQQWLLELLGHTRSIVTGAMPLAATAPSKDLVIRNVINVVTCSLLTLTYPTSISLDLWGISPRLFVSGCKESDEMSTPLISPTGQQMPDFVPGMENLYSNIAIYLPVIIDVLFQSPWNTILREMFDWLMTLLGLSETSSQDVALLHATLLVLRHNQEMRPASVWTKAF